MIKKIIYGLVLLLMVTCSGCTSVGTVEDKSLSDSEPISSSETIAGNFTINLTRDFGEIALDSREVELQSEWSLMEYMQREYQVTTGYGGSFITGLNELESTAGDEGNFDWFFFVNGAVASVGADQLKPVPADVVWWDYHRWSDAASPSAVIGCYPQPFVNRTAIILANSSYQEVAEECQRALTAQGALQVEIVDLAEGGIQLDKPEAPVIVIGTWSELQGNTYISKWNQAFARNGSSIHFTAGGIELLSVDGKVQKTLGEGTGVIVATAQGLGDNNPLWLVAGVDDQGVKEAARILCSQPEELRWKYGLAVQGSQIMALPAD
jgi:hypothetical protein